MKAVAGILIIVGYVCIALATISGIGYWLYLMGAVGLTFGPAAWGGFVLFIKMFVGGLVAMTVGAIAGVLK